MLSFVNRKNYRLKKGLVDSSCPDKGEECLEAEVEIAIITCDRPHCVSSIFSPTGSPQGQAVRWHSGGRQSQKQRKRLKSNTFEETGDQRKSSEGNPNKTGGTGKEEKKPAAW